MAIIQKIETFPLLAEFSKPFSFSGITRSASRNIIIKINTSEGIYGIGESCPVPGMSGETDVSIVKVIKEYFEPILIGSDPMNINALTKRIEKAIFGNIIAKAGINIALYDLVGKIMNVSISNLLGGSYREYVDINGSVGIGTTKEMINTAIGQIEECGVQYLKLYCGKDDVDKDIKKIKEISKEIHGKAELFIDVNQQWKTKEAIYAIRSLESEKLLFIEQPTPKCDIKGMADVCRSVNTPIAADEAVFSTNDVFMLAESRAADIITIYASKPGGIKKAVEAIMLSEAIGLDCFIGSYLELGVGTAAATHLSSLIPNLKYPCYLYGPKKYKIDILKEPLEIQEGKIKVPNGPGLGVDLDEELIKKCTQ
jgi:muconate cycloisomerase